LVGWDGELLLEDLLVVGAHPKVLDGSLHERQDGMVVGGELEDPFVAAVFDFLGQRVVAVDGHGLAFNEAESVLLHICVPRAGGDVFHVN